MGARVFVVSFVAACVMGLTVVGGGQPASDTSGDTCDLLGDACATSLVVADQEDEPRG